MKKSKKQESLLIQLLKEMTQGETLDHVVQRLQQELGADAPTADAVRGYLLHSGDSVGLDACQRALMIDQLLECVEVNFRTLCDVIRYRYLKPIEFMVLSYLCYHCTHSRSDEVVSTETVAEAVRLTVGTVKKYLSGLIKKGLVIDGWSLAPALQNTNSKNYFTLPNEIFLLDLPPSAFMVYAYLLLIEDRRTHQCHPSYNTIAAWTGLSKNTAMKSVTTLVERSLIVVESTSYFDRRGMKWKGNNLYTVLPTRTAVDAFHQLQLRQLELDAARRRAQARLSRPCATQVPLPAAGQHTTPPAP